MRMQYVVQIQATGQEEEMGMWYVVQIQATGQEEEHEDVVCGVPCGLYI